MNYIKRFIIGIILLELFNLIFGLLSNGKEALLPISGFNDPPLYYDIDSLYGPLVTAAVPTTEGGLVYSCLIRSRRSALQRDDSSLPGPSGTHTVKIRSVVGEAWELLPADFPLP